MPFQRFWMRAGVLFLRMIDLYPIHIKYREFTIPGSPLLYIPQ